MRLKELREKKGLSQKELATILGKSQQAIYYWEQETREPNIKALIQLASFFQVSVDYLLERVPDIDQPRKDVETLLTAYEQLSPEGQADIIQYTKFVGAKESAKD